MIRWFAILRGLVYAGGFVFFLYWVIIFFLPLEFPFPLPMPEWLVIPGFVIAIVGAAVDFWCIAMFAWIGKGTPAPFDAPREFVAVGPYRYVRNPMYLGALAIMGGLGLALHSLSAIC